VFFGEVIAENTGGSRSGVSEAEVGKQLIQNTSLSKFSL
jgi:hypothetical protein